MLFGTISSQIRMSFLKTKADFRINNIYLAKGNESSYLQTEKLLKHQRIGTLNSKLKAGQTLSQSELAFLRENSPELYAKAVKIMKERADYRDQLSKCKTKDEVQKVNNGKLQELASTAQQISSSDMDAGAKFEELEFVQMRLSGITNEHAAFMSTPEYRRLPWEHEKQRDEKKKTIKLVSSYDRLLLLEAEQRERNLRAERQASRDAQGRKRDTAEFGSREKTAENAAESGVSSAYTAASSGASRAAASSGAGRAAVSSNVGHAAVSPDAGRAAVSPDAGHAAVSPDAGRAAVLSDVGRTDRSSASPGARKGAPQRGRLSIIT